MVTHLQGLARRRRLVRRGSEAEHGGLILDILIGMAIFALIAFIAATAVSQYRARAYEQAALSDAQQIGEAVEADRIGEDTYVDATTTLPDGVTLSDGVTVAAFETSTDGENFAVCTEHRQGAWAVYNSSTGGIVESGREGSCEDATSMTVASGAPGGPGGAGDGDESGAMPTGGRVVVHGQNQGAGAFDIPEDLDDAVQVEVHVNEVIALKADGTVVAWGSLDSWYAERRLVNIPAELTDPATANVASISVGSGHALAVRTDGTVVAWGRNSNDQGYPQPTNQAIVPAALTDPATANVVAVAAGQNHSLALRADGTVVGWGSNLIYNQATPPAGLTDVVAISAGGNGSLALKSDGTVVAWGENNTYNQERTWANGQTDVAAIASGSNFHVVLKRDGTVHHSSRLNHPTTRMPTGLTDVVGISASSGNVVAWKADGTMFSWGFGNPSYGMHETQTHVVTGSAGDHFNAMIVTDDAPPRPPTPVRW